MSVNPIAIGNPRDPNNPGVNTISEGRENQIDIFQSVTNTVDKVLRTITPNTVFFTYIIIASNQTGATDTLEIYDGPSASGTQKVKLVLADDETIVIFLGGFMSFATSIVMLSGNASGGNPMNLTINGVEA